MNKQTTRKGVACYAPAIAAGLMLAMALTLNACGGDGGDEAPSSSSSGNGSPSSSSSGGGSLSSSSQPTHEHTWGEWSVTTAPTCEAGVETRTCAGDNSHKETRSIAKLFDWGEWTVKTPPTPAAAGVETRSCPNNASPAQTRPLYPKCSGTEYDPATHMCHFGMAKKFFIDNRDGQAYVYVQIGDQTWMAENLNFDVDGSRCYDDNTGGDSEGNCEIYGRLYDWATAMGLEASCNSSVCSSKIQPEHQGVCPSGWHIPSGVDWDALVAFIHADKGLINFTSGTSDYAGKHLKAASGWGSGNGTDDYSFSALPGGSGSSGGNFSNAGYRGIWWSSSENNGNIAYIRIMYYDNENANWNPIVKSSLYSVRCVQD